MESVSFSKRGCQRIQWYPLDLKLVPLKFPSHWPLEKWFTYVSWEENLHSLTTIIIARGTAQKINLHTEFLITNWKGPQTMSIVTMVDLLYIRPIQHDNKISQTELKLCIWFPILVSYKVMPSRNKYYLSFSNALETPVLKLLSFPRPPLPFELNPWTERLERTWKSCIFMLWNNHYKLSSLSIKKTASNITYYI